VWAGRVRPGRNTVFSGAGAWSLLTALLHGADGRARRELEAALFVGRDDAAQSVGEVWHVVTSTSGLAGAAGLWTHRDVAIEPAFADALPQFTIDALPTDRAALDRWANAHTAGLIRKFPVEVHAETRLVAATVLTAIAEWERPFASGSRRWSVDEQPRPWLSRADDIDAVALITSGRHTLSRVACRTVAGFDVHLVAGAPEDQPGEVLAIAIAALDGGAAITPGPRLRVGDRGGCMVVERVRSTGRDPQLQVSLPAFEVASDHDLLRDAELFGLVAAQDRSHGHFPGLSAYPLAVDRAAQSAVASFSAKGFKAAAVTAVAMVRAAGMITGEATVARVQLDRPFGFVVVERAHNLALFAGWIADPVPPKID
jgi:serine protease inhibitor